MTYLGKVKNGVVVLETGPKLADGTLVRVEPIPEGPVETGTLVSKLRRIAGRASGLPRDLARNHDHYLHAKPRE